MIEFDKDAVIIMVSAIGATSTVKSALMLGAKNYIVKPLNIEKIKEVIGRTLYLIEQDANK